ncbi:MAG: translocation/assembly module TamB domain-containing protein, partial [bacterium]|nr:translocation/assembly module TamB domain-containing protein [bacterium]
KAEATLKGIGKTIHLHLTGEAAEGGYGPVLAQKAAVTLDLTHPRLQLDGTILTDEKETGKALLTIQYGEKKAKEPRPKKITLDAEFKKHPIESSLPEGISGTLDARLKLSGAPEAIQGDCDFTASAGAIFSEEYETIDGHFKLTPKKLTLDKADFLFSNTEAHFIRPLVMDFKPGGFKISGRPLENIEMDIDHFGKTKTWKINKLVIVDSEDPELTSQISGKISPEGLDLKGNGDLDLATLKFLSRFIRDASGPAHFQLAVRGKVPNVQINGRVELKGNTLFPRIYSYAAENLEGTLLFEGNKIRTEKLTGDIESGSFETKGSVTHSGGSLSSFDLDFRGRQISYRDKKGGLRAEFDADLTLKGGTQNPELSGTIVILDGRYDKDFNLLEEFKKAPTASREIKEAALTKQPLKLDLKVKNLGDLTIDNNVGKMELVANITVKGTSKLPRVEGVIHTNEGEIHYLGFDFEITRGFIEFRDQYKAPYLEVDAEQEIGDAHILVKLHGNTDNLAVDLSGTSVQEGVLDKKDVLALLLFGTTEGSTRTGFIQSETSPYAVVERLATA